MPPRRWSLAKPGIWAVDLGGSPSVGPAALTTEQPASRGLGGRGLPSLGSLLPPPSGFQARFTDLAKLGRGQRSLRSHSPGTRISLSNSSQTKISGGAAGSGTTFPCKRQWGLTPLTSLRPGYHLLEPTWSDTPLAV